ncbi:hypothetical protein [Geomicrobium sp. JCM 19038]|uniref:hypothetical protein n=1 Tax=Geomicrobium sp. JCM 19038 TaxID=1460635 RepID=UPI001EE6680B|nr:hypothetical protein [Geomicrobium sp. JCM 19038]
MKRSQISPALTGRKMTGSPIESVEDLHCIGVWTSPAPSKESSCASSGYTGDGKRSFPDAPEAT